MTLTVHVFPVCDPACVVAPWMDVIDATMAPNLQGYQGGKGQLSPGVLSTSWLLAKVEKLRHIICFIKPSEFWIAETSRTLVSCLSLAQHSGVGTLP